jgi:hypothetical protein
MKRILFPPIFRSGHKCILHALEFAKIVQGELVLLHTFELPVYSTISFSENYLVIYESVELSI